MAINVAVTLRSLLTRALTWTELDNNFTAIKNGLSGAATDADLASPASGKGSKLIAFIQRLTGAVARWVEDKLSDVVSVKDFGAKGDDATDDTAAILAADAAAVAGNKSLFFPDGVYRHSRMALPNSSRHWYGRRAVLKPVSGAYMGDTTPLLTGSFSSDITVVFEGIVFDQNWIGTTYPSGFSRDDAYKASSWGGGSWYGVFDGDQSATVEFRNCVHLNTFRGFLVKSAKRLAVTGNRASCEASIGDSIIAAELCVNVDYSGNVLTARNWKQNPGYTGANGLFGNTCRNVSICGNQMRGFQLVFHATEPGAPDLGMGVRCTVANNTIEYPPADTAFYRWADIAVSANNIYFSGDMGIAISSSSFATVIGNVIKGTHVGGIGITQCQGVAVVGNSITDVAQSYSEINTLANRYTSNGGAWISGITCDYQSGGQKGVESVISGNTLSWTTLPPVSDTYGPIRAVVNGIYVQSSANTASQSTFAVTGNYVKDDSINMPYFFVNVPSHRFYIASGGKTGTPVPGEVFSNGGNSWVYCSDFGAGNLCFIKKLIGTVGTAVAFTGATSGAVIVSANPAPQLTWLKCTGAGNFDRATDYTNANLSP